VGEDRWRCGGCDRRSRHAANCGAPIFSLSHLAIPIPVNDPLYGIAHDPGSRGEFGLNLAVLDARDERGAPIVDQDFLSRLPEPGVAVLFGTGLLALPGLSGRVGWRLRARALGAPPSAASSAE